MQPDVTPAEAARALADVAARRRRVVWHQHPGVLPLLAVTAVAGSALMEASGGGALYVIGLLTWAGGIGAAVLLLLRLPLRPKFSRMAVFATIALVVVGVSLYIGLHTWLTSMEMPYSGTITNAVCLGGLAAGEAVLRRRAARAEAHR